MQPQLDLIIENKLLKEENAQQKREIEELLSENNNLREILKKYTDFKNRNEKSTKTEALLYLEQYRNKISQNVLKELQEISGKQRNDSTFILKIMRDIYENINVLKNETAKGTDGKSMMSQDKRQLIDGMFRDRLLKENLSSLEFEKRFGQITKLINYARNNIMKVRTFTQHLFKYLLIH